VQLPGQQQPRQVLGVPAIVLYAIPTRAGSSTEPRPHTRPGARPAPARARTQSGPPHTRPARGAASPRRTRRATVLAVPSQSGAPGSGLTAVKTIVTFAAIGGG
jgi:hypothetical protein